MTNIVDEFYIIHVDEDGATIENLCLLLGVNTLSTYSFFIPNIGETLIDRKTHIEYEVEDIARTIEGNKYGVQVRLKKREKRKYH